MSKNVQQEPNATEGACKNQEIPKKSKQKRKLFFERALVRVSTRQQ